MVTCRCVGVTLHCDMSTLSQVPFALHLLMARGPKPNIGMISEQYTPATSLAVITGHKTP